MTTHPTTMPRRHRTRWLAAVLVPIAFITQAESCSEALEEPKSTLGNDAPDDEPVAPASHVSPSDFSISMFITENQCFDSAGALITAEPDLSYIGNDDLDGREFTIVYSVAGETYNVDLQGDGQYRYDRVILDTPSCTSSLSARVTAVRER
jgi:hypothetical protein